MNIKLLFSLCVTSLIHTTYAQNYRNLDLAKYCFHYLYTFQQDSSNTELRKENYMTLFLGDKISKFESLGEYMKDSILNTGTTKDDYNLELSVIKQTEHLPLSDFSFYKIVKYQNSNETNLYEYIGGKHYIINEEIAFNWTPVSDQDTIILGYKCHKAITKYVGREFHAYYTTQIPLSEGPYKFRGLPGLIVTIFDSNKEHCFELSSTKTIKKPTPILLAGFNYINICMDEYIKTKRNDLNMRMIKYSYSTALNLNNEDNARIAASIKSRNNFIEKY